jgi:EAL domain-containing protein (putative c-di-GMP-specific phosphodiesterase class I)
MYAAKMNGRNRVMAFASDLDPENGERSVVDQLRDGIANGEIVLHYQPIVCLDRGTTVGVEALARWNHPERGLLLPADFVGLAEDSGLIHDLTQTVLSQAVTQLSTMPAELMISVNLSPKDLAFTGTVDVLKAELERTGVDPQRVMLEVTESSLISWDDLVVAQLEAILSTGIRLAVDDFGSGYSSLSQLLDLPIEIVKLDRKFVESVAVNESSRAVIRTVVDLVHLLGMVVVAEGIESAMQASVLRDLGCEFGQGYHFGRPIADLNALDAI